jgi:hypothetical protein
MEDIQQKKRMWLEVVLVIIFFILVVCGLIYSFQKIFASQPVQSIITFIKDEETLVKQSIVDTESSITHFIDETQYVISDKAPWLNLKKRPPSTPDAAIENLETDTSNLDENNASNTYPTESLKPEETALPNKN